MRLFDHPRIPQFKKFYFNQVKRFFDVSFPQSTNAYRVVTDEVRDITVGEQLCYICEICERKRRGQDCIPWNKRPNAEDITKKLLELLANCNLSKNCMSRLFQMVPKL